LCISHKEFDLILQCGKTPLTELACERSVRTSIISSRIVKGGFFTPDYLSYTIITKPVGYKVERRFNDFFWLRERLIQDYPGLFIPPIAKKTGGRSFEESFLKRRQDTLQQFLDSVSDHEELRSSTAFSSFVKFDGETFMIQKESLDKMAGKASKLVSGFSRKYFEGSERLRVADLNVKLGEVRCRIDHPTNKYAEYSEKLTKTVHDNYIKLRGLTEELVKDFDKTADTLSRMSQHLVAMSKIHQEFNESFAEGKWETVRKIYDSLGTAFGKWGESFKKSTKILQTNIIRSIKYSRKEYDVLEAYLQYRHDASNETYLAAQSLESRKESLFASGDTSKWELQLTNSQELPQGWAKNKQLAKASMLPEATSNLKEMRLFYGYINQAMIEQSSWLAKSRAKRYIGCIQGFCSELAELFDVVSCIMI
jgi:PX domain